MSIFVRRRSLVPRCCGMKGVAFFFRVVRASFPCRASAREIGTRVLTNVAIENASGAAGPSRRSNKKLRDLFRHNAKTKDVADVARIATTPDFAHSFCANTRNIAADQWRALTVSVNSHGTCLTRDTGTIGER